MRCIPKYRVGYHGKFYEAGWEFKIAPEDADEMRMHGTVLDDPTPPPAEPRRPVRTRRTNNGQSGKAETENRRTGRSNT